MKRIAPFFALLLCLFLNANLSLGQEANCPTETPEDFIHIRHQLPKLFNKEVNKQNQKLYSSSCINYAPIKAHIIRRSDGTDGMTELELHDAVDQMNVRFEAACAAFFICGSINYIDDDSYFDLNTQDEQALTSTNNETNIINIYFANSVSNGSLSYCGYTYFPGGQDVIIMNNSCATNGSTLSHEMGHFFGLAHTHAGNNELVDGSNCSTAGDGMCDTPADPQLGNSVVNTDCNYIGTAIDANGDTYNPNPQNLMSYSRKNCRDYFSPEQLATISLNFTTIRNYYNCAVFNADFEADNTFSCIAPNVVQFTDMGSGAETYEWDFENDGIVDATEANPVFTYTEQGTFDVKLTITNQGESITKIKPKYIVVNTQTLPYATDLQSMGINGLDDWRLSSESSFSWSFGAGNTTSTNTGPSNDHSMGSNDGFYLYTEASGSNAGDVTEFTSPCISLPTNAGALSLSFWYHMFGANMGELHIDVYNGTEWIIDYIDPISGQQQTSNSDPWQMVDIDLTSLKGNAIQVSFRGIRGNGYNSDMAIDDITFSAESLLPIELHRFEVDNKDKSHKLTWQTASETNSDHFIVEHSLDGNNFEPITKINAQGNSQEQNTYIFNYFEVKNGINYYRLKMVDQDGTYEYSKIIQASKKDKIDILKVFPNPVSSNLFVERPDSDKELRIVVYNAIGQITFSEVLQANELSKQINMNQSSNGLYRVAIYDQSNIVQSFSVMKI